MQSLPASRSETGVYIDGAYKEAARGLHDHAATSLLILAKCGLMGLIVGGLTHLVLRKRLWKALSIDDDSVPLGIRMSRLLRVAYLSACSAVFFIGLGLVEDIQAMAATQIYTYFNQSLTVCRPYIAPEDYYKFASRFASMKSKSDYLSVTTELKKIASINHLSLPSEPVW